MRPHALLLAVASVLVSSTAAAQCEIDQVFPSAVFGTDGKFGTSIAVYEGTALVGAPFDATPAGTGGAFVFERSPSGAWLPTAHLLPADLQVGDDFGFSVALADDVAAIGSYGDDDQGFEAGAVYVWERAGTSWFQTVKLYAPDPAPSGRFGYALALEADRLLVGAPGANGTAPSSGAAYAFQRVGPGAWIVDGKLADPLASPGDRFGASVGLGLPHALVGAPNHSLFGPESGAAYVAMTAGPGTWTPLIKLTASDGGPFDHFGAAVAIDGLLAGIGAPDDSDLCPSCGSAYLFQKIGPAWLEIGDLAEAASSLSSDLTGDDHLGAAVAVEGKTAAFGAPGNVAGGLASGSVYVYKEAKDGGFVQTNKLNACSTAGGDLFGSALALDSGTLAIGAPAVDHLAPNSGAAYFFSPDIIELENDQVAFHFAEAALFAAPPAADGGGSSPCDGEAPYPSIEIVDRIDQNPIFAGHRFVHRGELWDIGVVEHPLPADFTFDGYDVCAADEVHHAKPGDCAPQVDFDIEYGYQDPVTGLNGKLVTFTWTDCLAKNGGGAELGPFEVTVSLFLPQGGALARFDLGASAPSATDFAFWCGKLNLAVVEEHPDEPEPDVDYFLITPFGHLVKNPALNLIGDAAHGIPHVTDSLGRPADQALGIYDEDGRGLYLAMLDTSGERVKNFQYFGCPGNADTDPVVNVSSISYQEDVSAGAPFFSVPSMVGRFRGDWYTLADAYRGWLAGEALFTHKGLVSDRDDVPSFAKAIEQVGVFGVTLEKYANPPATKIQAPGGGLGLGLLSTGQRGAVDYGPLPERLRQYMEYWDLGSFVAAQFGTGWVRGQCSGVGEYAITPLFAENALAMEAMQADLAAEGKDLRFLMYFIDAYYSTAGRSLDWNEIAVHSPAGDPLTADCPDGTPLVLIDPSAPQWQEHVRGVAESLGALGVDGIYCDNAFPDLLQYDFEGAGHAPGFGPYMTEGFADMFAALQQGGDEGKPGPGPEFMTYTEFFFEGFIPKSDTYGPEQAWTDWMTADANTVSVPLLSVLYHHYTILGPPFVGYYTHDLPPFNYPNNVLNLMSAAERARGRTGANYTMAYGWVNGTPIWSPDPAIANPRVKLFSYELVEADYNLPAGTFDALRGVCAFGATLARVRGWPLAAPFLTTGRRMRDLAVFATSGGSTDVVLQEIYNPFNTSLKLGPETEQKPTVLHGVWRDDNTGYLGIALANYTLQAETATFVFDPAKYGFTGLVSAYLVDGAGESLHTGPFSNPTTINMAVPAEGTAFLRIRP